MTSDQEKRIALGTIAVIEPIVANINSAAYAAAVAEARASGKRYVEGKDYFAKLEHFANLEITKLRNNPATGEQIIKALTTRYFGRNAAKLKAMEASLATQKLKGPREL